MWYKIKYWFNNDFDKDGPMILVMIFIIFTLTALIHYFVCIGGPNIPGNSSQIGSSREQYQMLVD